MIRSRISHRRGRVCPAGWRFLPFVVSLACAAPAIADGGRNLSGVFDVRDRVEDGDQCTITFAVRITNVSGFSIDAMALRLAGNLDPDASFARFPTVAVADRASVQFTASVQLPCAEIDRWDVGLAPMLVNDGSHIEPVELTRGPVPVEMPQ